MASTALALAGGSVTGRLHVAAGRPNQDAWHWVATDAALVACVCDGCGSSPHSELGAQLGARLLASALHAALLARPASDPLPRIC